MLKNYFKTAWRNLYRNKSYTAINILGLTIGLAACLVVATVVIDDLSYDRQWSRSKDLYRVISVDNQVKGEAFPLSFSGLGPTLKRSFPEVEDFCRISSSTERLRLGRGKDGVELHSLQTEPSIWHLLDLKVTEGHPQQYVAGVVNLVISEKIKKLYFGHTDPIGKTVYSIPTFGSSQPMLITGVIQDIAANTHLRADVLTILNFTADQNNLEKSEYGTFLAQYLLMRPHTSMAAFTAKVNRWYTRDIVGKKPNYLYRFQPISDVYLHSGDLMNEGTVSGSIRNVYIFGGVAIMLLLIACINFINLTTARALSRIRETGIRRSLGAKRFQLIIQFLCESLIFFFISFSCALLIYPLSIQAVEGFVGHTLAITLSGSLILLTATFGTVLVVCLFTGLYPAWLLSHPQPVKVLGGKISAKSDTSWVRRSLVVMQFSLSAVILMAAIIIQLQLHFLNHVQLGFDQTNLLSIGFTAWGEKGQAFQQQVKSLPGVENASITHWVPSEGAATMYMEIPNPANPASKIIVNYIEGDIDLVPTLKLQLESGRMLDPRLSTDALNSDSLMGKSMDQFEAIEKTQPVLVTQHTAQLLGIRKLNQPVEGLEGIPVGIVRDFHNESLRDPLSPCVIRADRNPAYGAMLVRIRSGSQANVLASLQAIAHQTYPDRIFSFDWVSDLLTAQYRGEQDLQKLISFFAGLMVFLACLGLFGLAVYTAEQRTKEIGIRKVVGASVSDIVRLLTKDTTRLVLISIAIASPLTLVAMNRWLRDYANRIQLHAWIFLAGGMVIMVFALVTVCSLALRAALANPVNSLRAE